MSKRIRIAGGVSTGLEVPLSPAAPAAQPSLPSQHKHAPLASSQSLKNKILAAAVPSPPPAPCVPRDRSLVRRLISETWLFLETECVLDVMDNLGRLIPGRPVRELLLDDPTWLLRAQRGQKWLGEWWIAGRGEDLPGD